MLQAIAGYDAKDAWSRGQEVVVHGWVYGLHNGLLEDLALTAGKAAAAAFVVALGLVGASVGAIALGAYGIYSAFKLVITSATRVLSGVQRLRTQLVAQWRDIGGDIAAGIADGLLRAAIGPVGAITSLGSSMVDALKSALDIHSPSRVFARLGLQIPAGVEQGVERGAPQMNRTVAELVSVPTNRAQVRDAARTVGGTTTVTFGDMHIHVSNDDSDPESIARAVREQVASMLEGAGLAMGVPS